MAAKLRVLLPSGTKKKLIEPSKKVIGNLRSKLKGLVSMTRQRTMFELLSEEELKRKINEVQTNID